jgi:predicted nucleotidyltransferase
MLYARLSAMTSLISENAEQLRAIARRRCVRRLAVFGSALTDEFDAGRSDIDLLVEFDDLAPGERADAYFSLLEDLESLFGRRVDLVERSALRNPIVRESVEATQVVVYDAA